MEPDLRKHIIALLELMIICNDDYGLTERRLSEAEHKLNLSRNRMREAIRNLGARGAAKTVIDDPKLPYGVSQVFVTEAGKLYYHQLVEESRQITEKTIIPTEIKESRESFAEDYPDPSKVGFIMMKFKQTPAHNRVVKAVRNTLKSRGLVGVRSDDKEYHSDLYYNVLTYMHGCGFGIAVFDRIEEEEFSPNVSLEVGYMLALRKNVCILRDKNLRTLPVDLLGMLYKPFDPQDPENTIRDSLLQWLSDKRIGTSISVERGIPVGSEAKEGKQISAGDLSPEEIAILKSLPPAAFNIRLYRKEDGSLVLQYDEV